MRWDILYRHPPAPRRAVIALQFAVAGELGDGVLREVELRQRMSPG